MCAVWDTYLRSSHVCARVSLECTQTNIPVGSQHMHCVLVMVTEAAESGDCAPAMPRPLLALTVLHAVPPLPLILEESILIHISPNSYTIDRHRGRGRGRDRGRGRGRDRGSGGGRGRREEMNRALVDTPRDADMSSRR